MKSIKLALKQYIKENLSIIFLILIFFLLGFITSVIYSQMLDINSKIDFTEYMNSFNKNILNGEYSITYYSVIKNTIKYLVIDVFVILIFGYTVLLTKIIYCLFAYKGFEIGFFTCIAIMLLGNVKGTIYSMFIAILPNIITMLFEILICIIWLKFSKNILKENNLYYIKKKVMNNTVITMIIAIFMISFLVPINIIINMNIKNFLNIL